MMRLVIAALSGALFGAGLAISGMIDPARVRGWLDLFGNWDPTLGFVLTGAILPMLLAWRLAARHSTSISGVAMPPPPPQRIDTRLIVGAGLFGLGWGFAGLCPGPAIASIGFGGAPFLIFFAAMVAGMLIFAFWNRRA